MEADWVGLIALERIRSLKSSNPRIQIACSEIIKPEFRVPLLTREPVVVRRGHQTGNQVPVCVVGIGVGNGAAGVSEKLHAAQPIITVEVSAGVTDDAEIDQVNAISVNLGQTR